MLDARANGYASLVHVVAIQQIFPLEELLRLGTPRKEGLDRLARLLRPQAGLRTARTAPDKGHLQRAHANDERAHGAEHGG